MDLLKALVRDLRSPLVWSQWLEAMVRNVPGEVGIALRRWVTGRKFKRAGENLIIYFGAIISGHEKLEVGRNCRIGFHNMIQASGGIEIGDDVLFGPGVKVWSVNHVSTSTDIPIWDQGYEHKKVVIGNGVWLGANSFIMPGAYIGEHTIIAAGSVVSGKPVEPYSILAGNPARKIGSRLNRQLPSEVREE